MCVDNFEYYLLQFSLFKPEFNCCHNFALKWTDKFTAINNVSQPTFQKVQFTD